MDSRKIERILLLILALLNLFLLTVVLSDREQDRRSKAETAASLTALLEENGLTVTPGAFEIRSAPPKCTLTRDLEAERRLIRSMIGTNEAEDQGGNIYFYTGSRGKAQLRGSGEMDVIFDWGAVSQRGSAERTALRLLRRGGVKAAVVGQRGSEDSLTVCSMLDGIPVYNALLRFTFDSGYVSMISGTRIFDTAVKEDAALLDSVSVLIRFVELIHDEGYICSRIDALEPGYLQTVTRSGEAALTPVWRVETDAGAFLIDAETGKAESRLS